MSETDTVLPETEGHVPDPSIDAESEGGGEETVESRRRPSLRRLEEEGEIAADYLEELLDIIDVDGDIDIDVENGRASLAIVSEGPDRDLRSLVGAGNEVLDALQDLVRLAVQAGTGERSRLMLDIAGVRSTRKAELTTRTLVAVAEVRSAGAEVRLEPMSAFERKVVHDVVAESGLSSGSEGVEPERRVVIRPAG